MRRKFPPLKIAVLLLTAFILQPSAPAQERDVTEINAVITDWLQLGPCPNPLPVFHESENRGFSAVDLLLFKEIDIRNIEPEEGKSLVWHDGSRISWKSVKTEQRILNLTSHSTQPSVAYLGMYIEVKRWIQAKFLIQTPQVYSLYLDGNQITQKKISRRVKNGGKQPLGETVTTEMLLETGKHLIVVKTVHDPQTFTDWKLSATLQFELEFGKPIPPRFTLSPKRHMSIGDLLDGPKTAGVTISPDGKVAGILFRQSLPPSSQSTSWLQLFDLEEGKVSHTYPGAYFPSLEWSRDGKYFAYTTTQNSHTTLWIVDRKTGETRSFIDKLINFGSFTWAPDSSYIIFSLTEEGKNDLEGTKRFRNMEDRLPGARNRSYLYKATLPDCVCQRLTAGELTTNLNSISPDGSKLLFSRSVIDYTKRPFSHTQLYSLDLGSLQSELLWEGPWINSAQWIPDGKKLLILGGPSAFGEIGTNLPQGIISNEYDVQAYFFNPKTKEVDAITRDFDPSIEQAYFDEKKAGIFFLTGDKSFRQLYRYDVRSRNFLRMDTGVEVIQQFAMANDEQIAIYSGSSSAIPPRVFTVNLSDYQFKIFKDPGKATFQDVSFGRVEDWSFKNRQGTEIEGRVYYPPDFKNSERYPCIVYYYGGTSPVTRDFGGRYPKNLWAANGYVVYVLQPSGATGFGQEFSAKHVNDWGITVSDEIIQGTTKFLESHPFVDPKRVGCIGASYGGFMTMLLMTRTNMFASAIAHAGISSISSYWGEGYWGYLYSAIATANSYPWNRKDIYVDQSPLFNADKISSPLLLLHGSVDTNVPTGESTQLFAALRLLGREVEYIQIDDQDHHILEYNKRRIWTKTILAWFDKWLKNQPTWWASLYPKK
ncbi:S9 family peptidase [Acidobacteriota bacterium]